MVSLRHVCKRDVIVWGTGLDAVRYVYFLHRQKIPVKCILNNHHKMDTCMGYPVCEPDQSVCGSGYVIIAVGTIKTYQEISKQLTQLSLREFEDYIYYKWIDRKLAFLHGNCHMTVIQSYLESSVIFQEKYAVYPNPLIYENKKGNIEERVLKYCDIWIHEDIQNDNPYGYYLSDEYIRMKWLKYEKEMSGCKKEIIIPHLFGLGKAFFPQSGHNRRNESINNAEDANGMFPHADKVIDKCVEQNMSVDSIIAFCKGNRVFDQKTVLDNFNYYMNKIKEEKNHGILRFMILFYAITKRESFFMTKDIQRISC